MADIYINELKYNITGKLKNIAKEMVKNYTVKVGLLADNGGSESIGEDLDLAGLGALQEFGADIKITQKMAAYLHFKAKELGLSPKQGKGDGYIHIPARSWLYEPIAKGDLLKRIKEYIADVDFWEEFAKKEDYKELAKIIAMVCILQIQNAFQNGGINGEWAKNSDFTTASKGSNKPLLDTGYLWQHVTYEIEEK